MRTYTLKQGEPDAFYEATVEHNTQEELIALLKDKRIVKYRTKTVRAGNQVYVEVYPIWRTNAELKQARQNVTRDAQVKLNDKNAKKHAVYLVNQNFTDNDFWSTFTYRDSDLPKTKEEAEKRFKAFIRTLRTVAMKRYGIKLKFFWVTEYKKGAIRCHHHLITNFPSGDEMESLWKFGGRNNVRRLCADEYGYEGLVLYLLKGEKNGRRYHVSRGMEKYKVTVADGKVTRGRINKLIFGEEPIKEFFEKNYPNYDFTDSKCSISNVMSGAYLCVRMRKKDGGEACHTYQRGTR